MATVTLEYLIPELRLSLGDINPASYRYTDEWLLVALNFSIKFLGRWWNFKYLMNDSEEVYRNPNTVFLFPEPPVIEVYDEGIILVAARIIIKQGTLENNAWSAVAWRDAEISFSNLEGQRSRKDSLNSDWEELFSLITPPTKRLARPIKSSHPGYNNNIFENKPDS